MTGITFPIAEPGEALEPHYIAAARQPDTVMMWDGTFEHDCGTMTVARFATPEAALAAARANAAGHAAGPRIWPPTNDSVGGHGPWWITGESEDGGMVPGAWPFMICRTTPLSGTYETVCTGIQRPDQAHLIAAAPALLDALHRCAKALAALRIEAQAPGDPLSAALKHLQPDLNAAKTLARRAGDQARGVPPGLCRTGQTPAPA